MRVIVDANIIVAALLGSRSTIAILFSQNYKLYSPKFLIDEIKNKKELLCNLRNINSNEFDINLTALLILVKTIDKFEYDEYIENSTKLIGKRDIKDIDYIACALYIKADFIWTNDKDFSEQNLIKIMTTEEIINNKGGFCLRK